MADKKSQQSPGESANSFNKGMLKDYNDTYIGEGLYTHARNAVNNSHLGQVGVIANEPSNLKCLTLPYTMIGCIHLSDDHWCIYTTDDTDSEIGIFDESQCTYTKIVNDRCLNFKTSNLITGAYRQRFDCERLVYWEDGGLNPSRVLDLDRVPFITKTEVIEDCVVETPTTKLNCEAIRLAPLITYPCLELKKGRGAGSLLNGSYQVALGYTINGVKVTDYIGLSEVQSIFDHNNISGSLEVNITSIDKRFDEFELILLSNVNQQTLIKKVGYYSTNLSTIYIDRIDLESITVPITSAILRSESIEKADAMYPVGDYLLRVGTYSKYRFNYQLQANNIETRWVAVDYPASYYHDGGNNTGYMRDEIYSFFIRWIYNTGDRSDSYHIPGRVILNSDKGNAAGPDAYELNDGVKVKKWQVENTAKPISTTTSTLSDGGEVKLSGIMGYWESTEKYPDNAPEIWGDLCGKPIRHHKFPDETVDVELSIFSDRGSTITLLGVEFLNITHPLDQNGDPITSIVGYEILRGSREGNRTIIGKGILNNMREYNVPGGTSIKGLYQNYPYNDLGRDVYLTSTEQLGNNATDNDATLGVYKKDYFSFHGPDVTFNNPYLYASEVKVYQEYYGTATGYFTTPYRHPRFKIASNAISIITVVLAALAGAAKIIGTFAGGDATLQLQGTEGISLTSDLLVKHRTDPLLGAFVGTAGAGYIGNTGVVATDLVATTKRNAANSAITILNGTIVSLMAPLTLKVQQQQLFNIFYGFLPKRQYAAQYNSYGFYNRTTDTPEGNRRRKILDSKYIGSHVQGFNSSYQINNLNRSRIVVIQTDLPIDNPKNTDDSRFTLSKNGYSLNTNVSSNISSFYGALKVPLPSQYGQLDSIKQIQVSSCIQNTAPEKYVKYNSPVYFGGDVYINRFTEKNSMFFFNEWLMGQPDLTEIDYTLYINTPYPRFWINTSEIHSEFINVASRYHSLDGTKTKGFYIDQGWFYLFNSGVRDFFVESEINTAYRDWDDAPAKRHYDPYRYIDLAEMFRSDIIKSGNYYKYDYSLSVSKMFNSFVSWGSILPRDYDPIAAATCYTYRPSRVVYSLPQQNESRKDSWRAFLVNNYKDFLSPVTSIKQVNKTGALFMMKRQSPLQFMGVDQLETDQGLKVTIGDGGLFNQALQALVNVDEAYEYGSCQNKSSVVATLHGIFWVSQDQGKVFVYANGLKEISKEGMKWWFAKYLPSDLIKQFPDYKYADNPVKGIGVQTIYDNTNEILYITKKDYKPIIDLVYEPSTARFYTDNTGSKIYRDFTDTTAFQDASWTISYDPKSETWISFHDWIPTFLIPGKAHFMSVNVDSIWKHNSRCDSYCNFYDVDHPFEIEFVSSTGQTITTLRNIEYILEAYKYYNDCRDKFHVLDRNFDEAVIYNSEQISGVLQLNIKPKNDPLALLNYPRVTNDYIDILYAKEENKYRFNQFWDITRDRSEFVPLNQPDPLNIPMFNTEANGYKFEINRQYINYDKSPLERKKFRHMINRVFLRRKLNGNVQFLFKISNLKIQQSFR